MVSSCPRRLSLVAWPDMSCCRFGPTTSAVFCASPHMRVGDAHGSREPIARSDIALRRCDLLLSKPVSHRPTASGPRGGGGANLYGHAFRYLPVFSGFRLDDALQHGHPLVELVLGRWGGCCVVPKRRVGTFAWVLTRHQVACARCARAGLLRVAS